MKILICGSRDFYFEKPIQDTIESLPNDTVIIEGGAPGADTLARKLAEDRGLKVIEFKADWQKHGRAAGPIRNKKMLEEGKPDMVYAFYIDKGASTGTQDMVEKASNAGVKVIEYDFSKETNRDTIKLYARSNLAAPHIIDDVMLAKQGDKNATSRVTKKIATEEYLNKLRKEMGDQSNTVYIPIVSFDDSNNILPDYYAQHLAEHLGGTVLKDALLYGNAKDKRKELNQWERMISHRDFIIFDKECLKDKNIILVDDQYTTGGTIRDAYITLRQEGIKVTNIVCLGASRERGFLCAKNSIEQMKKRFTSQELSKIRSLTSENLYDMTQSEVSLILKTNKENVIPKLEQAYKNIYEKPATYDNLPIPDQPEIEEPQSQYFFQIKNDRIMEVVKGTEYFEGIKNKMVDCTRLLNEDPGLVSDQKQSVAAALADPKYYSLWLKNELTPKNILNVGKLLSEKVPAKDVLKTLDKDEERLVKSVVRSFSCSNELSR